MTHPTLPSRGVLVTGASRGVGAAVARAFARRGDRVVVHHRSPESRDRAEAVLAELPGEGHAVVAADLSDPDAVRHLCDEAVGALGRVDVLVNNAAMIVRPSTGRVSRRGDHPLELNLEKGSPPSLGTVADRRDHRCCSGIP